MPAGFERARLARLAARLTRALSNPTFEARRLLDEHRPAFRLDAATSPRMAPQIGAATWVSLTNRTFKEMGGLSR